MEMSDGSRSMLTPNSEQGEEALQNEDGEEDMEQEEVSQGFSSSSAQDEAVEEDMEQENVNQALSSSSSAQAEEDGQDMETGEEDTVQEDVQLPMSISNSEHGEGGEKGNKQGEEQEVNMEQEGKSSQDNKFSTTEESSNGDLFSGEETSKVSKTTKKTSKLSSEILGEIRSIVSGTAKEQANIVRKQTNDVTSIDKEPPKLINAPTEEFDASYNQDILDEISEFNDAEEVIEESSNNSAVITDVTQILEENPKESTIVGKTKSDATASQEKSNPSGKKLKQTYKPNANLETLVEKLVRQKVKGPSKECNDWNQSKASNEVSRCLEEGCKYETRCGQGFIKRHRRLKHLVGPIPHAHYPCPFKGCFYSTQLKDEFTQHMKDGHNFKGKVRTWCFQEDQGKPATEEEADESNTNDSEELSCSYEGCGFEASSLSGLKKHITMKHLKTGRRGPKKRKDSDTGKVDQVDLEGQTLKKIKLIRTPSESGWRATVKQDEEPAVRARSQPIRFRDEQEDPHIRVRVPPREKEPTSSALPKIKKCQVRLKKLPPGTASSIRLKDPKSPIKSYERKTKIAKAKHIRTDNLMAILLKMSKLKEGHTWSRVYSEASKPSEVNSVIYDLIEEHASKCDDCLTHLKSSDLDLKKNHEDNLSMDEMKEKIARLEQKLSVMTEKMALWQAVQTGDYQFKDLLTGVGKPQFWKKNDYTVKQGFRLIDIHVLRLALQAAQGCGHNNLMIAEANASTGQEDLATQIALFCSVCGNQTIFTSSSYSDEEPTNYTINKCLLPLLGPGAYYSLVSFVQKSENSLPVHIKAPRYAHAGQKAKLLMTLDKKQYSALNESFKHSIIADDANICEPSEPEQSTGPLGRTPVIKSTAEIVLGSDTSSSQMSRPLLTLRATSSLTQSLKESTSHIAPWMNEMMENENIPSTVDRSVPIRTSQYNIEYQQRRNPPLTVPSSTNTDNQQKRFPPLTIPTSTDTLNIPGGVVTPVAPGTKIVANNVVQTTTSKVKLPSGVYKFTKSDGTDSVLIVKEDGAASNAEEHADDDVVEVQPEKETTDKQNSTSYKTPLQMFSTEVSEAIKKQLPQLSNFQVQKIVIDRWAKMTEREKQVYREKALDDMNRYPPKSSQSANVEPMLHDPKLPAAWFRSVVQRQSGDSSGQYEVFIHGRGRKFRSSYGLAKFCKENNITEIDPETVDWTVCGESRGQQNQPKRTSLMANVSSISVTNGGTSNMGSLSNRSLLKEQLQTPSNPGNETVSAGRVVQSNSGKKMVKMKLNGPDGTCKEILVPAVDGPHGTLKVAIPKNYSVPPGGNYQVKPQVQQVKQPNILPKIAPKPNLLMVSVGDGQVKDMNNFVEVNVSNNEKEMHYEDPEEEEEDEEVEEVDNSDSDGEWTPSKENMSQKRKRNRY